MHLVHVTCTFNCLKPTYTFNDYPLNLWRNVYSLQTFFHRNNIRMNCIKLQFDILRSNEGHFPTKLYSQWSIQTMKFQKLLPILTPPNLAERHTFWSLFVLIKAVFILIRWQRNDVSKCIAEQRQLSKPRIVFSVHMACRYLEATNKRLCKAGSRVKAGMASIYCCF